RRRYTAVWAAGPPRESAPAGSRPSPSRNSPAPAQGSAVDRFIDRIPPSNRSMRLSKNPPAEGFGGKDSVKGCPAGRFGAQPPQSGGTWRGDEPSGFPFALDQTTF